MVYLRHISSHCRPPLRPSGGKIINPRVLSPELSIEIAVWVAIGGRGSLVGAIFERSWLVA